MLRIFLRQVMVTAGLVVFALPGHALDDVEVVLMGGQQFGGQFERESTNEAWQIDDAAAAALIVGWQQSSDQRMEVWLSQQSTQLQPEAGTESGFDLAMRYAHVGGTYLLEAEPFETFVSGGLGLTHMAPQDRALDDEWRLSLSLGLGVRVPLGERAGLRFEARGFGTSVSGGGSLFCGEGRCDLQVSTSLLWQTAAFFGFGVVF